MKLNEFLDVFSCDNEITVIDDTYDVEMYFYGGHPDYTDKFEVSTYKLANLLDVVKIDVTYDKQILVTVNLYELITEHAKELEKSELFRRSDIESIMDSMHAIISGYVDDEWMGKFVAILEK